MDRKEAHPSRHWLLLVVTTLVFAALTHSIQMGCEDSRACRDNRPCRVVVKLSNQDGATVTYAYLCDLNTALCRTKCTQHTDCDVCKGFICESGKCVSAKTDGGLSPQVKGITCCSKPGEACEGLACNQFCNGYACIKGIGQCRKDKCSSNVQCDPCKQFGCVGGKCVKSTDVKKPEGCPSAAEPVQESAPEGEGENPAENDAGEPASEPAKESAAEKASGDGGGG